MKLRPKTPAANRPDDAVPSLIKTRGLGPEPRLTTPLRSWLFRVLAGILVPLLVLVLLELALRLGGYGYATGFFKPMSIGGQAMLVENDQFGFRFFPPDMARTPASLRIPVKKAAGTYRIFILGESAALGDPEPAFGAGRYLEMLLRDRFPKGKFEIINVAMTAINSHAILPIARDCARQEGDLWILYMGNNEMVGPFGAATVFGSQAPPLEMVRFNLAIQKLRVGQLLAELGRKLTGGDSRNIAWSGMNMFAENVVVAGDPRKLAVYRNFESNLQDIVRAGLDSGAQILLSTIAVNLKDCAPFGSLINSNLAAGERRQVEQLLAAGTSLVERGNPTEGLKLYEQAARFNPQLAELEFRLGNCRLQQTSVAAARTHFQQAVDLDCLPFRADSRINALISKVALAFPGVTLFDANAALDSDLNQGIPGQEDFYEHVHLNFSGNYRLARGWAEQVSHRLPTTISAGAGATWASQALCEQRLGLTQWERCSVLAEVGRRLQQPPLSSQFNNARRLQNILQQETDLRQHMDAAAAQQARDNYLAALNKSPDDYYLLENFGYFLADRGDIAGAIQIWVKVRDLIPQDHAAYYELGRLLTRQKKFAEAKTLLQTAVAIHPSFAPGWSELGRAQAEGGDYEAALSSFAQALKFDPQSAPTWFDSGLALAMLNRRTEAIEHYRQAVRLAPADWKAHFELGGLLGQAGKMAEAKTESAAAVRLNPDFPTAHLNLGMALVQLREFDEAEIQFQETLRLDPHNAKVADYLAQTRALQKGTP